MTRMKNVAWWMWVFVAGCSAPSPVTAGPPPQVVAEPALVCGSERLLGATGRSTTGRECLWSHFERGAPAIFESIVQGKEGRTTRTITVRGAKSVQLSTEEYDKMAVGPTRVTTTVQCSGLRHSGEELFVTGCDGGANPELHL